MTNPKMMCTYLSRNRNKIAVDKSEVEQDIELDGEHFVMADSHDSPLGYQ